jgi:hypothetical protein
MREKATPAPGTTLTRTFDILDANGDPRELRLQAFIPEESAGSEEPFRATVEFRLVGDMFPGVEWITIHGVDAIDAILNCLDVAATHLRSFRDATGVRLQWFGDDNFGLPAPFSPRE